MRSVPHELGKWFIINTLLASCIFFLSFKGHHDNINLWYQFLTFQLNFQVISYCCLLTALFLSPRIPVSSLTLRFFIDLGLFQLAAQIGVVLLITFTLLVVTTSKSWFELYSSTLPGTPIITGVISVVMARINYLDSRRRDLENSLLEIQKGFTETACEIRIKEKGTEYIIPCDSILYLSAAGPRSNLHTEQKDYTVRRLLKILVEELPPGVFLRVHKSYIVNKNKIRKLEYNQGGTYRAYLDDEDDTCIPVGRVYAAELKTALALT